VSAPPTLTFASASTAPHAPIHDCRILVVDDTDFNRTLIGALLNEAGFHRLCYAVNGVEALAMIADDKPDLVILDIMMPQMDGFEVLRRLRADKTTADLPVLVQTALSGTEDRNRAFAAGTTDLVSKPLDRAELLARVKIHLENRVLIRDLQTFRHRVESELDMARSMYDHLLPGASALARLKKASGLAILSHTLLSSELGGDIWGVHALPGGRIGVYLLDMAGRGVLAALNAFRMHTLIHEMIETAGDDPAGFLSLLNSRAVELLARGDHAAMVYGVVDCTANTFCYAVGAAANPMMLKGDGTVEQAGDLVGLPLGVSADATYERACMPFVRGDALMLYSNAVLDALDIRSNPPGSAGLVALVGEACGGADPECAFRHVTTTLAEKVGETPLDDHSLVWLFHAPEGTDG